MEISEDEKGRRILFAFAKCWEIGAICRGGPKLEVYLVLSHPNLGGAVCHVHPYLRPARQLCYYGMMWSAGQGHGLAWST